MKTLSPLLFLPLSINTQSAFLPLWDGAFLIPEAIRKIFTAPSKPGNDLQKQAGEKRIEKRRKLQVAVLAYPLLPHPSDSPLRGDLKNMGEKGVCVAFLKDLEENHLFMLNFKLPEKKGVRLPARVIWSRNHLSGFELLNEDQTQKIPEETAWDIS